MVSLLGINKSDTAALTRPDATFNHYWINTTLKLTGDAHLFPIDHVFQGITTSSKAINVRAGGGINNCVVIVVIGMTYAPHPDFVSHYFSDHSSCTTPYTGTRTVQHFILFLLYS